MSARKQRDRDISQLLSQKEGLPVALATPLSKRLGSRLGMMELCLGEPQTAGRKTYYLARSISTFAYAETWPMALSQEQSWPIDLEEIARFRPDGVWWFGCGPVSNDAARRALLKKTEGVGK